MVVSERHDKVCLSREDDEPDFVAGQGINQLVGRGARFIQAGGLYVLRFHGAGDIQRNEQVAPGGGGSAFPIPIDRAGECNDSAGERQQGECGRQRGAPKGAPVHQLTVLG